MLEKNKRVIHKISLMLIFSALLGWSSWGKVVAEAGKAVERKQPTKAYVNQLVQGEDGLCASGTIGPVSTFETGAECWQTEEAGTILGARHSTSGGYISGQNTNSAAALFFVAPPKFLGNQSAVYGQTLHFRLRRAAGPTFSKPEEYPKPVFISDWGRGDSGNKALFCLAVSKSRSVGNVQHSDKRKCRLEKTDR